MENRVLRVLILGAVVSLLPGLLRAQATADATNPSQAKAPDQAPAALAAASQSTETPAAPPAQTSESETLAKDAVPEPAAGKGHDNSFVIGNSDLLGIHVWREPDVSRSLPVRSDGNISLPLVGELKAAGKTPLQLEGDICAKLQKYITDPEVTVIVEQINSLKFNILGQVARPGTYTLTLPITVLDAIAEAGGFRDFAKKKSIYVLRRDANGGETSIPFNYKEVIKGVNPEQNIKLQPRDTVVVP